MTQDETQICTIITSVWETNLGPLVFVNLVYYHPADPSHGLEATGAELSILKCAWIDNKI